MLGFLLSYLLLYKYLVLFLVVAGASFGFPIPATALVIAAGAFIAQGYFDFAGVAICVFFASLAGDFSGYFVSRRFGRDVFARIGLGKVLRSARFRSVESTFAKHAAMSVFLTRFLATGLGPGTNILAGLAKTPYWQFFSYAIAGEFLYVFLFLGLGYAFGDQWEAISAIAQDAGAIIMLSVILIGLFATLVRVRRTRR